MGVLFSMEKTRHIVCDEPKLKINLSCLVGVLKGHAT